MEPMEDFPLVRQVPVSIVQVSFDSTETLALRGVLECFNYRVEIHWVGSRPQFLEILKGNITTFDHVILSCHGDEHAFVVPYQNPVTAEDLAQLIHLPGRTVLSLGCGTGTEAIAATFLKGGCKAYIAPTVGIEANAAMLFSIHLYYFLGTGLTIEEAVKESRNHDAQCALFKLFQ